MRQNKPSPTPPDSKLKTPVPANQAARYLPQHCLYFLPLPQGHGSLRPTFGPVCFGFGFGLLRSLAASLTISLALFDLSGGLPPSKGLGGGSCLVLVGAFRRKFSNAISDDALLNALWQISVLMFTINSSKILNASALYSSSGSRWPCARRPMLWRRLSISS